MEKYRKDVVKKFIEKLQTKDGIKLGVKVLASVFDCVGERNKYELYDIMN